MDILAGAAAHKEIYRDVTTVLLQYCYRYRTSEFSNTCVLYTIPHDLQSLPKVEVVRSDFDAPSSGMAI